MSDILKTLVAYALYLMAFTLLLPFLPLRLLWRSQQAPAYRERILERFGISSIKPSPGGIWVHAVSVGEAVAIAPTIKKLLDADPDRTVTVTTMTPTGSERVKKMLGDRVKHVYAPYDWPLFVWLFLVRVKPSVAIVVETELWPVTLGLCRLLDVEVLVANARLSQKSADGYAKIRWLAAPMFAGLHIAAQHEADAQRFVALGANEQQVDVTGSVKFDIEVAPDVREQALELRSRIGIDTLQESDSSMRFIWIAASTHEGEDAIVLEAHRILLQQHPEALLVLVPRHPERFDSVAGQVVAQGMPMTRRSEKAVVPASTRVLLADTMGELLMLYGVADVAFVGGSFVPVGGHNYLEASAWGLPVLSGPHRHNFEAIAAELEQRGALEVVQSAEQLAGRLKELRDNPRAGREAGYAAVKLIEANRGATEKVLEKISQLIG